MGKLRNKRGLVLEGGGTAGIGHLGMLEEMDEHIYKQLTHFAGSSAGAIAAGALACRADVPFMKKMLMSVDFNKFKDDSIGVVRDLYRLVENFGWYKGDAIEKWYGKVLKKLTGSADITLREVAQKYGTYIVIPITDVRKSGMYTVYTNPKSHPNLMLREAVRRSAGIPLYYQAKFNETADGTDHIYIDGGVLDNFPMGAFDGILDPSEVIGSKLCKTKELDPSIQDKLDMQPVENLIEFIEVMGKGLRNQALKYHISKGDWERTIKIDVLSYSATDFDMTEDDKKILLNQGRLGLQKFLCE